jgi:hypothetical protein
MFSEEKGIGNDDDKVVTLVFVVGDSILVIIIRIINDFTMGGGCCNCFCGCRFFW